MRRKKFGETLLILALIMVIVYTIQAGIYWWRNPELTQMEVFKDTFVWSIPAGILTIVAIVYDAWLKWSAE